MKSIFALACLFMSMFASFTNCVAQPVPVPVILTFDTELDGDIAALKTLNIAVPATYFFTGKFALAYPEIVDTLARAGNTIGSHSYAHPHLPKISQDSLASEIRMSKTLLESITKKKVVWFRAPYMEYDERVMKSLRAQGFLYDSSDSEHWEAQSVLTELPISDIRRGDMLASDYDLIVEQHMSEKQFEDALKELYRSKSILGQPAVILLHPKNAALYPNAIRNFIDFVKKEGGRFVTADKYVAEIQAKKLSRYAVWVDFSKGALSPEYIAANIARTSITDVFLMAKDAQGNFYYGPKSANNMFEKTLALLRQQVPTVKIHAWLPALSDTQALRKHHTWAMTAQNGRLSANWMSPANPEVATYMKSTITDLVRNYKVDGIHLDGLSYTGHDYDFSSQSIEAFAKSQGLAAKPTLTDLLTKYYNPWVNWRSTKMYDYAATLGEAIKTAGKSKVEYSAELLGERVFNFKDAELSGQEIPLLAQVFDFLVPSVEISGTPEDRELIGRTMTSFRIKAGEKPLVMRLVGPYNGRHISQESLSAIIDLLSKGSNGIGFSSYHLIFGNQSGAPFLDEQGLNSINRVFGGRGLKPFVKPSTGSLTYHNIPVLPGGFTMLMAVIFNMVAIPVFGRKADQHHFEGIDAVQDQGKIRWNDIEQKIRAGVLDGTSSEQICSMLRSYDARGIHQNRIVLVLDAISNPGSPMPRLYDVVSGSREWKSLALKYFHEVCLLGYAEIDDRNVTLTPQGWELLERARADGFEVSFWSFIESRLHEAVLVQCPLCGAENITHFFWSSYECSACGKLQHLGESALVSVFTPEGSLLFKDTVDVV
ncbi:MAG: polysaccharide deacetylase family protein [Chlorobiaceae bacterium]|nr:polysaccharide deacetylase family protein [Chlorobiaceae bacterium]